MKKIARQFKYQLEQRFLRASGEIRVTLWSDASASKRKIKEHHKQLLVDARNGGLSESILFTLHTLVSQGDGWETQFTEALEGYAPPNVSRETAKEKGFKTFNNCPHHLVEVPNGNFTISCRLSDGSKVSFAFCSYDSDNSAAPGCVDVQVDTGIEDHQVTRKDGQISLLQGGVLFADQNLEPRAKDIRITPKDGHSLMSVFLKRHY